MAKKSDKQPEVSKDLWIAPRYSLKGPAGERAWENRPGGAANTAANLAALGAQVVLLGVVGIDSAGEAVCRCLAEAGVDPGGLVVDRSRPTAYKCRILAGEHYVARVDSEPSAVLPPAVEQQLLERLDAELGSVDVVIVSDYGLGSVSHATMLLVSRAARRQRGS